MKKQLIFFSLIISIVIVACGQQLCSVNGCKNDAVIEGMCGAHNQIAKEEEKQAEEVLAEANTILEDEKPEYNLHGLSYSIPSEGWEQVDSTEDSVMWKKDDPDRPIAVNIRYDEADIANEMAKYDSFEAFAKAMYKDIVNDSQAAGMGFDTFDIQGCPAYEVRIKGHSGGFDDNIVVQIFSDKYYYSILVATNRFSKKSEEIIDYLKNSIAISDTGTTSVSESPLDMDVAIAETTNDGYQFIFDYYSQQIKDATPKLVQEYQKEASGISNVSKLAEISNSKISKLAEISNEGISEMADFMYDIHGRYDDYSEWADKLMGVYTEEANKIMEAYLDSAL